MRQFIAVPLIVAAIGLGACSGSGESENAAGAVDTTNEVSAVDSEGTLDNATLDAGNVADATTDFNSVDAGNNTAELTTNAL